MMQIKDKISELKKKLPRGSQKEIAKRTNLTERTVANCLNRNKASFNNTIAIIKEANNLLEEIQNEIKL